MIIWVFKTSRLSYKITQFVILQKAIIGESCMYELKLPQQIVFSYFDKVTVYAPGKQFRCDSILPCFVL